MWVPVVPVLAVVGALILSGGDEGIIVVVFETAPQPTSFFGVILNLYEVPF